MKNRPDESTRIYAANVLTRHLTALNAEIAGVRAAKDIEPVHRMRVATRRFRSTLPLFASCFADEEIKEWNRAVREIGQALGEARDTDVKVDYLKSVLAELPDKTYQMGIHRLMVRLEQNRNVQQVKILKLLDKIEANGSILKISEKLGASAGPVEAGAPFSSGLYEIGYRSIENYRQDLLAFEPVVDHPEMKTELHQMRVAAKRLRYALEAFTPMYPAELNKFTKIVRTIQDQLGNLHDLDVWTSFLETYRIEETQRTLDYYGYTWPVKRHWAGINYLSALFSDRRTEVYQEFHDSWGEWNKTGSWNRLHQMIALPISLNQEIYPPRPAQTGTPDPQGTGS
jgi:CHAD domain-containing protein